ncbi:Biopolymer transport protein ExbD/TolR [Flavobacterium aquidurense]|uniref:Biopolymer transporter ExbD n=1 Tax=Flavobacterium frigidimaris TaxID=262320 RepID=A0ABX4BVV4_FLAFR|nr:biopolymer transporter ExbD [Flavobacterium frigidimaris]OXA81714.1 biopolymer transporter ExbD [Flavobacterium frigidimaris]SDZ54717.1 Biopolymer transport protein ExbD/TolR [Flavobacterium aquidurense]
MEILPKKVRSKKLSTRVDLTAMVSISFLLIIFFMVTIELAKPNGLDLGLPDKNPTCGGWHGGCIDGNRLYTILLNDNDQIITYSGLLEFENNVVKEIDYSKNGIRKEVFRKKNEISEYMTAMGKPKSGVIVIIKPSNKCNYKNLVDILDEMKIANINTYAIVNEFSPEETKLLASK